MVIDEMDKRLIRLLQKDARRSSDVLARDLGINPATVRRRTRSLLKNEVIHIEAIASPEKVGLPLAVVIAFDVTHNLDAIMKFMASRPEVEWVSRCTGRFDAIAIARFASTEELRSFVRKQITKLDGVRDTETFVCLEVEERRWDGCNPMS